MQLLLLGCILYFTTFHPRTDAFSLEEGEKKKVVCYYTTWSYKREMNPKYNFYPDKVDPFLCTHIIYAFADIGVKNNLIPANPEFDFNQRAYVNITSLKKKNKSLKVMIGIGGWVHGTVGFGLVSATDTNRTEIAKNAARFLRGYNFDGLDLNWQHPTFREGGSHDDKQNYVLLAQTLREEFEREAASKNKPRLLLSIAISNQEKFLPGYDIPGFNKERVHEPDTNLFRQMVCNSQSVLLDSIFVSAPRLILVDVTTLYMDFISVICYDYHFSYETEVNHHSPLYPLHEDKDYGYDPQINTNYTIHYFLEQADAAKLVLGVPVYGRTFTLVDPHDNGLGAEADGPGAPGPVLGAKGFLSYFEICNLIRNENWTVVQTIPGNAGPYAYKGNQWVGFDDIQMIKNKAEYALEHDLGGVMFWTIDYDDFLGECHDTSYPIIRSARDLLIGSDSENDVEPDEVKQETDSVRPVEINTPSTTAAITKTVPKTSPTPKSQTTTNTPPPIDEPKTSNDDPKSDRDSEDLQESELLPTTQDDVTEPTLSRFSLSQLIRLLQSYDRLTKNPRGRSNARIVYKTKPGGAVSGGGQTLVVDNVGTSPLLLGLYNSSINIGRVNIYHTGVTPPSLDV